jgi:hypothetical protein
MPRAFRANSLSQFGPVVVRAFAIRIEAASQVDGHDSKVRAVLFNQRAR